jgi:ribosomal protein S18 acetylase RimI-like enzyme
MYTYRKAVKEDCSAILDLVRELALYERAPEKVTVTLEHFTDSGFGTSPLWWAYVCELDGVMVGFALYYIRFSTWEGQRMYLEDLYIQDTHRRNGIGEALMNLLKKDAKEKNLNGIVWQVLEWNQLAIDFYNKLDADIDPEWYNCCFKKEQL